MASQTAAETAALQRTGARHGVPLVFYPTISVYALAVAARALGGSGLAWFCC